MGPKTFGTRYTFDKDKGGMERYGDLIHHPDCNQEDVIISKFMNIEEQTAVVLENIRRRDAKGVANALVGSREERQRSKSSCLDLNAMNCLILVIHIQILIQATMLRCPRRRAHINIQDTTPVLALSTTKFVSFSSVTARN